MRSKEEHPPVPERFDDQYGRWAHRAHDVDWVQGHDSAGPTLRYVGPTTGAYKAPRWSDLESFDLEETSDEFSSVYLIHAPDTGRVKIGQSRQVYKRFSHIRAHSGADVELVAVLQDADERDLHKRFADRRIVGEWFDESVLDDLRADGTI